MGEIRDLEQAGSSGSARESKPIKPGSQKFREVTSVVRQLGEKELGAMLATIGKSSIRELTSADLKRLFVLIPPEQERSDATPNVNYVLFKKQQHDLETICRNPLYQDTCFGIALPKPSEVDTMNSPEVRARLLELTNKVEQMLITTGFTPARHMSPHALLRNPDELQRLLFYSAIGFSFTKLPIDNFRNRGRISTSLEGLVEAHVRALPHIFKAAESVQLQPSPRMEALISQALELSFVLRQAKTPEEFAKACEDSANVYIALVNEQRQMQQQLIQRMKDRLTTLSLYTDIPADHMGQIQKLFEGPQKGREAEWCEQMVKWNEIFQPYLTIVETTEAFLAPYLSGEIRPETEDVRRKSLTQAIVPMVRKRFPTTPIEDHEIEHLVLSVYLKAGSRQFDLPKHRAFYENSLSQAEPYTRPKTGEKVPKEETPEFQLAKETFAMAKEHLAAFTSGLNHSLAIDFKEMGLTEKEISWLAKYTFGNPSTTLPLDWRDRVTG